MKAVLPVPLLVWKEVPYNTNKCYFYATGKVKSQAYDDYHVVNQDNVAKFICRFPKVKVQCAKYHLLVLALPLNGKRLSPSAHIQYIHLAYSISVDLRFMH